MASLSVFSKKTCGFLVALRLFRCNDEKNSLASSFIKFHLARIEMGGKDEIVIFSNGYSK
jgi:hypothetical protein